MVRANETMLWKDTIHQEDKYDICCKSFKHSAYLWHTYNLVFTSPLLWIIWFKCDWTYHQSPHPEERDGILMSLRKSLIHVLWLSQNTNWGIQLVLIVKCELQNVNLLKFETSNLKICIYLIILIMGINGFERYLVSKVSTLESCVSLERTRVNIKYWRLHAMWSKLNSNLYQFSGKRSQKYFRWLYKYVSKRKPSSVKLCKIDTSEILRKLYKIIRGLKVKISFAVLICLIQFWKLIKERECIKSSCWANWNIHHWNLNNLKISNITGFEWFRRIKGWLHFSF